jgi:hypothetical protein
VHAGIVSIIMQGADPTHYFLSMRYLLAVEQPPSDCPEYDDDLWVIRTLSALGIKDFRGVLLGMLRGVTAPPIDLLKPCNYVTNVAPSS